MREKPETLAPRTEAQIFDENALGYVQRGLFAEISPESESWASWKAYFRQINHAVMLNVMRAHERRSWLGKNGLMAPTEWPADFDERAPTLPAMRPEQGPTESDMYRAEVVRRLLTGWKRT